MLRAIILFSFLLFVANGCLVSVSTNILPTNFTSGDVVQVRYFLNGSDCVNYGETTFYLASADQDSYLYWYRLDDSTVNVSHVYSYGFYLSDTYSYDGNYVIEVQISDHAGNVDSGLSNLFTINKFNDKNLEKLAWTIILAIVLPILVVAACCAVIICFCCGCCCWAGRGYWKNNAYNNLPVQSEKVSYAYVQDPRAISQASYYPPQYQGTYPSQNQYQ